MVLSKRLNRIPPLNITLIGFYWVRGSILSNVILKPRMNNVTLVNGVFSILPFCKGLGKALSKMVLKGYRSCLARWCNCFISLYYQVWPWPPPISLGITGYFRGCCKTQFTQFLQKFTKKAFQECYIKTNNQKAIFQPAKPDCLIHYQISGQRMPIKSKVYPPLYLRRISTHTSE